MRCDVPNSALVHLFINIKRNLYFIHLHQYYETLTSNFDKTIEYLEKIGVTYIGWMREAKLQ